MCAAVRSGTVWADSHINEGAEEVMQHQKLLFNANFIIDTNAITPCAKGKVRNEFQQTESSYSARISRISSACHHTYVASTQHQNLPRAAVVQCTC